MPTFYDGFRQYADRYPENICVEIQRKDSLERHTYAEMRRMAESTGRWLKENGLAEGARCAILADNSPRWVAAYLAVIAAGCTVVPLDTALHADQLQKLLRDSGTSLLFYAAKYSKNAEGASAGLSIRRVIMDSAETSETLSTLDRIFAAGPADFQPADSPSDGIASLLYTSGTTADPKGVMLSHANLLGEVECVFNLLQFGPEDALLGVLPLFHVLSQMANLLFPLIKGSRIVYLETLNTTELLRALSERDITAFAVVPQFFYLIHERIFKEVAKRGRLAKTAFGAMIRVNRFTRRLGWNLGGIFFGRIHKTFGPRMRYPVTGGSRFDPNIHRDFHDLGIDVLQAYGLTETTGGAFVTPPGKIVFGSVGPPLPGVEGKIVDPQPGQDGSPAVGEIAIRGPLVMKGYWKRPDATEEVLRDGWLHTGDLGYFDGDGNLFITGRQKDVIVLSNGKNVYPEEIEAHYLQSPYIKEICVIGIEGRPGDPLSDRLHGVIVLNFDVLKERRVVNSKEVIRYDVESLSSTLASTKRLGSYEIWQEDLPRTTTRKLKRFEIEKRVRTNQAGGAPSGEHSSAKPLSVEEQAWLNDPRIQKGLSIIRDVGKTRPEQIRPSDNLELDLGFDSMQRVELLVALQEQLGGNLDESRLAEIYTVRELLDAVRDSATKESPGARRAQVTAWKNILQEEPTDPQVLTLKRTGTLREYFWYGVSRLIALFSHVAFGLKVAGLEKLPKHGAFILSSNHQSYIDPVVLAGVLPGRVVRRTFAVGTSEIFGGGFMRLLASWINVVVVDPDANLLPAMRAGGFGLRHGRVLVLYPEGERSIDGPPKIFKKGAAILSIQLQVPIVPIAIEGFHDAWPRNRRFQKFARLKIQFGDPIYPPPESEASEGAYEQLTADLKARVVEMWNGLHDGRSS
jgi:long-chain acyl-CoA synthetase